MQKQKRRQVYEKYDGHCAYCGKEIEYKDMQVDHVLPKRLNAPDGITNGMQNLKPACRRCNHYKRGHSLELFRNLMQTLDERVRDIYICKVAEDYGIIKVEPWDGKFYFERVKDNDKD